MAVAIALQVPLFVVEIRPIPGWLATINDVRLMLGVRLEVTESSTPLDFEDDDRAASYAVYAFLSWLEEDVVSALAGAKG